MALGLDSAYPIDLLEDPSEAIDGYIDVMDFPSGGQHRKGSDVLDHLIQLEKVEAPTKGKQFLDNVVANALYGPTQVAGVTKLPRANPGDFSESMPGGSQIPGGPGWYNEDNPGKYDKDFPSPFGEDMFPRAAVPAALGYVG